MKAILISIRPQWVTKILNGEKTIEVRKTAPKCELPCEVYIYCTKNEYLYRTNKGYFASKKPLRVGKGTEYTFAYSDEGMVVAKFTLNKVENIKCYDIGFGVRYVIPNNDPREYPLCEKSCLTQKELNAYLQEKTGYAWHIDNLVIFDKSKELKELNKVGAPTYEQIKAILSDGYTMERHKKYLADLGYAVAKAPQSWCYCEVDE